VSRSQRQPKPQTRASGRLRLDYAVDSETYLPSESEESAESTDDSDGETQRFNHASEGSIRVGQRARRRSASSASVKDPEERFSTTLQDIQTLWERSRAENAELQKQLKAREPKGISARKQRSDKLIMDVLKERVYTLLGDNAELRMENHRLLKQARRRNQGRSASVRGSDSSSEPASDEDRESETLLNSEDVIAGAKHNAKRGISPEIEVLQGTSSASQNVLDKERNVKTLFIRFLNIMSDTTKYEAMKCDRCPTKKAWWRLPCSHGLCANCWQSWNARSAKENHCIICHHPYQPDDVLHLHCDELRERSWTQLQAVVDEWMAIEPYAGEADGEGARRLSPHAEVDEHSGEEEEVEADVMPDRSSSSSSNTSLATPPKTPLQEPSHSGPGRRLLKRLDTSSRVVLSPEPLHRPSAEPSTARQVPASSEPPAAYDAASGWKGDGEAAEHADSPDSPTTPARAVPTDPSAPSTIQSWSSPVQKRKRGVDFSEIQQFKSPRQDSLLISRISMSPAV